MAEQQEKRFHVLDNVMRLDPLTKSTRQLTTWTPAPQTELPSKDIYKKKTLNDKNNKRVNATETFRRQFQVTVRKRDSRGRHLECTWINVTVSRLITRQAREMYIAIEWNCKVKDGCSRRWKTFTDASLSLSENHLHIMCKFQVDSPCPG